MEPLIIKSSKGGRSLTFSNRSGDYFDVELSGNAIFAKKKVWGYTDTELLVDLFDSIARDWKGWEGERGWVAIEGDLRITTTSDKLGHVRLDVAIRNHDPDDDWRIEAPIFLDAGGLEALALKIRTFFAP